MEHAERINPAAVKLKSYAVSQAGRGLKVTLPVDWIRDMGLVKGDRLELFRDTEDRLIIVPPKKDGAQ